MHALPPLLFRDAALMRLVGCNAHQGRQGGCPRGAVQRQGPRTPGPIGPDARAANLGKRHRRDWEAVFNRVIRALAKAGVCAATVPGIVDATELETTAPYKDCGQVTRQRKITDKRGKVHAIEGMVYGWKRMVLLEARTQLPLAAKVVPLQAHATLSWRALVTQARTNLASYARLSTVVFAQGLGDGGELGWLAQRELRLVVPATDNMAVTVDARAQAAAGEDITVGRRVHPVRHGQGTTAWSERLATAVVGIAGLPPSDQDGTAEPGRHANRRDFQAQPMNAVVVRKWHNRD